jgi:uncharacterized protein
MSRRTILIVAWVVALLVSILPDVILNEIFKVSPNWLFPAKLGLLALALVVSVAWKPIRPLWQYFLVFLLLSLAEDGIARLGETMKWKSWFVHQVPFTMSMLGTQLLRIIVAIFMVVVMLVLKRKFSEFYLVKGDLGAEAKPIPVLMSKPASWKKLGIILSACVTSGTLLFLYLAGRPSLGALGATTPMFPMILILAAMNAFSEEMNYRATVLGALNNVTTGPQAVMLAALFFGIGHYYGVPYGIIGVLMAWFLGWLLGKSMIESKGFFWAWFIHFLQDVAIFSFMAIGSVTPGSS